MTVRPEQLEDFAALAEARVAWARGARLMGGFRGAVRARPDSLRALVEAGRAAGQVFLVGEAEALLERAARLGGDDPRVAPVLAASLAGIAREARAIVLLEALRTPTPAARGELARLLDRAGRTDAALAELGALVVAAPTAPEPRLATARILRSRGDLDAAWRALRAVPDEAAPRVRAEALAERAALLEAEGDADGAAEAMAHAHAVVRRLPGFDGLLAQQRANDAAIGALTLDAARLRRWREEAGAHPRMAHLIGFPRSGTTLLERMLDAHPGLTASPERAVFTRASLPSMLQAGGGPLADGTLDALGPEALAPIRAHHLAAMEGLAGAPLAGRVHVDKNPNHTGLLPALLRLWPASRLLVALRDPRDVVTSCAMRLFHLTEFSAALTDWGAACRLYAAEMGAWLRHRDALPPDAWVEIRYEDVVADPQASARRALSALGLPWDEAVSRYREGLEGRTIASPSHAEVRRPVHDAAVGRWRRHEERLRPHMHVLAPFVAAFGYEPA